VAFASHRKRGRLGFCEGSRPAFASEYPLPGFWRQVEEKTGISSIGQVRGNAGAHGSGARRRRGAPSKAQRRS